MSKSATAVDPLVALAGAPTGPQPKPCKVARTLDELGDTPRGRALAFLTTESAHSDRAIAEACRAAGLPIGKETIRAHRQKICSCPAE